MAGEKVRSSAPRADHAAQGLAVHRIVLGQHPVVRCLARLGQDGLVVLRQLVPLLLVDDEVQHGAALPPAGGVIVFGDFQEAELLVVVGADELGRIEGAALQRRIDVAGRDLLRHDAELRQHLAAEAADAELEALQVIDRVDLLAEEAAHLGAGIAAGEGGGSCTAPAPR